MAAAAWPSWLSAAYWLALIWTAFVFCVDLFGPTDIPASARSPASRIFFFVVRGATILALLAGHGSLGGIR